MTMAGFFFEFCWVKPLQGVPFEAWHSSVNIYDLIFTHRILI